MKNNYRQFYKDYYKIDFDETYAIHHIDFDRSNNDISNLLLLPRSLHSRYHMIANALGCKNGLGEFNFQIKDLADDYEIKMLKNMCDTLSEIRKWVNKKNVMEYWKDNEDELALFSVFLQTKE